MDKRVGVGTACYMHPWRTDPVCDKRPLPWSGCVCSAVCDSCPPTSADHWPLDPGQVTLDGSDRVCRCVFVCVRETTGV